VVLLYCEGKGGGLEEEINNGPRIAPRGAVRSLKHRFKTIPETQ
jgi:hypothetical protein